MGHFGPENGTPSYLWIGPKNFFKILQNEMAGANRYMKILLVVFTIWLGQIEPGHC